MRLKLGLAVASLAITSIVVSGAGTSAVIAAEDPTTTTVPTTTTTTTTVPPVIAGPASVGAGGTVDGQDSEATPPERGTSVVINPPPPPPETTTTTTVAPINYNLPANSGSGFRVVYSKSVQKVWVVDANNQILKEHRVSGRQRSCDPTPGSYRVFSRSRYTFSLENPALIWGYMIRFTRGCNGGNIGFHEIPVNKNTGRAVQSINQLGTPLSGGCVRQAQPDAVWMWNNIGVGTSVVVVG